MKKKGLWALASLLLAVVTVWIIIKQSGMSLGDFIHYLSSANPVWVGVGFLSMLAFIFTEGVALIQVTGACGYPQKLRRGFVYSAADIYLSAITPSGTGGQPGIAFFMMKDGISLAVVTAALMVNLVGFNIALVFFGAVGMVGGFDTFLSYNGLGKTLIIIGFCVFIGTGIFAAMMLRHRNVIFRIASKFLGFLHKIHLLKNREKYEKKLEKVAEEYATCVSVVSRHKGMWFYAILMNILQRFCQIAVTVFAYMALGGKENLPRLFATQCLATIGSTTVPIPGAMGISDYLMLEGYMQFMPREHAFQVQMLSRGISFYSCVIISGFTILIAFALLAKKTKKKGEKESLSETMEKISAQTEQVQTEMTQSEMTEGISGQVTADQEIAVQESEDQIISDREIIDQETIDQKNIAQ